MQLDITPLIIVQDEIANLPRTLSKLYWAHHIVVVDSGSTDGTLELLAQNPTVEVFSRTFDSFAGQCNFGLSRVRTEWVLSLDADYELSDNIIDEIQRLQANTEFDGYSAKFVFRVFGRALNASLYPSRVVLFRRSMASYHDEGHAHRVFIKGKVAKLRGVIYHDDRKSLSRWMGSQQRYASSESDYLLLSERRALGFIDRLRLSGVVPVLIIIPYVILIKMAWRAGWYGWYYALQRLFAETAIALELLDRRVRNKEDSPGS